MFEILSVALAIAALIFARKAMSKSEELSLRIAHLEQSIAGPTPVQTAAPVTAPTPAAPTMAARPTEAPQTTTAQAATSPVTPSPVSPPPTPPRATATPPSAPSPGFEEQIGTRWVVVLGGITLAIGGIFMVRYSIEQGLLGPAARTIIGGLFAAALIVAGEWARRRDNLPQMPWSSVANIPATLTAAGTAVAFATVYAAYALYGFFSPATAFLLLGAVAIATLAAALLHGPALAGLGVVGAFITPVLVSSNRPDLWALYIYIAVVTAAAFALARIRMWRWLAMTTFVFALIWTLPGLQTGPTMVDPHDFHVIAGFALAASLVVCGFMFGPEADAGRIEPVSSISLAVYLLASTLIVLTSGHADSALTVFGFLVIATLFVAWRAEAAVGAVSAGAALVAIVFAEWAVLATTDLLVVPGGALAGIGPGPRDESIALHLWAAIGFAAAFGGAGLLAQGRSTRAAIPVIWSASAVFVPLALLIALYARITQFDRSIPFAVTAIALAGAFAAATEWLTRREQKPGMPISTALFATGALAALALGLTFALERGWLTISLALMSAGTAWVALQRPIPFLRWLAAIFAGIVVARIGWEPRIAGDAVGSTPIFNWLLYGYGVPALSFWLAGYLLRGRTDDAPARMVDSAAILFTALLAFMEIRHAVNGGDVYRADSGLAEMGLQVSTALAMAIGLKRLYRKTNSIVHQAGASVMTALALIGAVGGLFIVDMPMISGEAVGGPFINLLLLGYAMPAVLAALLAWTSSGHDLKDYTTAIAGAALVLALAYVSLEIRRLYHGPVLSEGSTGDAEQYTYSVAWLAFGVVLLGAGLFRDSQRARLASAVVIALTIAKVFLIDMSELTGVYRALSFMGLGLVLVAIGWLYQRILFRPSPAASTPT